MKMEENACAAAVSSKSNRLAHPVLQTGV